MGINKCDVALLYIYGIWVKQNRPLVWHTCPVGCHHISNSVVVTHCVVSCQTPL